MGLCVIRWSALNTHSFVTHSPSLHSCWNVYGLYMASIWAIDGQNMGHVCAIYGPYMGHIWAHIWTHICPILSMGVEEGAQPPLQRRGSGGRQPPRWNHIWAIYGPMYGPYIREPTEGGFTKGGVCEKRPREGLVVVRKWPGFLGSKFWKIGPDLC